MPLGDTLDLRFRVTAEAQGAQKAVESLRSSVSRSAASISQSLSTSFRQAGRDSEGLFTALDQLRIGIEQLARGSLGGIPNLFKSFRAFRADANDVRSTLKLFDAALASVGVKATTAKDLFDEFAIRVKSGASGIGDEAKTVQQAFRTLGIDITDALIRPEQAFRSILTTIGRFGVDSREGKAALDLLGAGMGDVGKAAGIAGQSLTQLSGGFGALTIAAGATAAALAVAAVAVGVAIAGVVVAAKGMISTAEEVGTKSKEKFDEFKKAVESAGFSVTALDRALSQQLTRAAESVKGAIDGLFIGLIRTAGPALTGLLNQITGLLRDLEPLAQKIGSALEVAFNAASSAVQFFRDLIALAQRDLLAFFVNLNPESILVGIIAGFRAAAAEAERLRKNVPAATFDDKDRTENASKARLRILEIELQAAQRLFNEQSEQAERMFERQAISFEQMVARIRKAAADLLAARQRLLAAERKEAETGDLPEQQRAVKLAEIREKEQQALSDFNKTINQLEDDTLERQKKRTADLLDFYRQAFEARRKLNQELASLALEARQIQLEVARVNLADLQRGASTQARRRAIEEELRLDIEAEAIRREQFLVSIERQKQELLETARTEQERIDIEKRFNELEEAEFRRHQQIVEQLNEEAQRARERLNPLSARSIFGEEFADVLAQTESQLQAFGALFRSVFDEIARSALSVRGIIQQFTGALTQMLSTLFATGKTGAAAFRSLAAAILAQIVVAAGVKALFEVAEGIKESALAAAAAAVFDFRGAALHSTAASIHFAAAKAYGLIAGGAAIAGGVLAATAGGGGGGGAGIGGGGLGSQEPPQININRGGEGERLGVGEADALSGIFGTRDAAVDRLATAVESLERRINSMRPGDVITAGAPEATPAIGQAVATELRRSGELTNDIGRLVFGPA